MRIQSFLFLLSFCFLSCTQHSRVASSRITAENDLSPELAYDLDNINDQFLIFQKLQGDLSGKKTFNYSEGRVFGIRPDRPDSLSLFGKEVFKYTGCSMKIMRLNKDGNVESKSKGWLFYQDPETKEYLTEMVNPYTKKKVDVPPFRAGIRGGLATPNGPKIDATFTMESTAIGNPIDLEFNIIGERVHVTRHAFTKWFEKKSQTWRTEMTLDTYDFSLKYLQDRAYTHIPADYHWTSETSWLSILDMGGTPGHMIWTSSGTTFYEMGDLPEAFVEATKERQTDIFSEPLTWE